MHAQAALLLEEPYGFFGAFNPTGHNAIYLQRVCAETPTHLRRCEPGEMGVVIARYSGMEGYDWVAVPLVPYLYATEDLASVPAHVDRAMVIKMRDHYKESELQQFWPHPPGGSIFSDGWPDLIGVAYERRTYVFRFETTEAQDDALIAKLNGGPNRSHFNLLYQNCADFARTVLGNYFPGKFRRNLFPDAMMTTPKQLAWKLQRYARQHPGTQFSVFEIPQVPGYRRMSRSNKTVAESLVTNLYAVPIALLNPYIAGGIVVDYLVQGRLHAIPKNPAVLEPRDLSTLTTSGVTAQNPASADIQAPVAVVNDSADTRTPASVALGLKEMKASHE
jgi:hypothetical protein